MGATTRGCAAVLLVVLVWFGGGVEAANATPTAPYTEAYTDPFFTVAANQCTVTLAPFDGNAIDVPTDGKPHTLDLAASATSVKIGDAADKTTITFKQHLVGSIGSRGVNPSAITLKFSGSTVSVRDKTPSQCQPTGMLGSTMRFAFTLTKPMWVDVRALNHGNSYAEAYLWNADDDSSHYVELYGKGMNFSGGQRTYLPAGHWGGYLEGDINLGPTFGPTGSGALSMIFNETGARTAGPSGTAKPYVGFPGIRDCAGHNATLKLTGDGTLAKTITKVVAAVNGRKVRTIWSGFRSRAIRLGLADDAPANVKVSVSTVQTRHGKKIRKTRTVAASYLACT